MNENCIIFKIYISLLLLYLKITSFCNCYSYLYPLNLYFISVGFSSCVAPMAVTVFRQILIRSDQLAHDLQKVSIINFIAQSICKLKGVHLSIVLINFSATCLLVEIRAFPITL